MGFYGMGNESMMLEDALEAGGIAWWLIELPSGTVFYSPNKLKMLGYSEKDVDKFVHYSSFTDLLHPNDYERDMKAMRDLIDGKSDLYEARYRIKAKDGSYKLFYDRGRIVARGAKTGDLAIAGIVLDVTAANSLSPTPFVKELTE